MSEEAVQISPDTGNGNLEKTQSDAMVAEGAMGSDIGETTDALGAEGGPETEEPADEDQDDTDNEGTQAEGEEAPKDGKSLSYCDVCQVHIGGVARFEKHALGKRHKMNLRNIKRGIPIQKPKKSKPRVRKEIEKKLRLQPKLDECKEPLIGLECVTEFQDEDPEIEVHYVCKLCDVTCDSNKIMSHIRSLQHRSNYMKENHEDYYKQLNEREGDERPVLARELAGSIEEDGGRKEMVLHFELNPFYNAHNQRGMKRPLPDQSGKKSKSRKEITRKPRITAAFAKWKEPLVGLEYLTEFQEEDPAVEARYVCSLCEAKCDPRNLWTHLTGFRHRSLYMQKGDPEKYTEVTETMKKSDQVKALEDYAKKVESKEGRKDVRVRVECNPAYRAQLQPNKNLPPDHGWFEGPGNFPGRGQGRGPGFPGPGRFYPNPFGPPRGGGPHNMMYGPDRGGYGGPFHPRGRGAIGGWAGGRGAWRGGHGGWHGNEMPDWEDQSYMERFGDGFHRGGYGGWDRGGRGRPFRDNSFGNEHNVAKSSSPYSLGLVQDEGPDSHGNLDSQDESSIAKQLSSVLTEALMQIQKKIKPSSSEQYGAGGPSHREGRGRGVGRGAGRGQRFHRGYYN